MAHNQQTAADRRLQFLEFLRQTAKNSDMQKYYEELFSPDTFSAPPSGLGTVTVRPRTFECDDALPATEVILQQFQQLLITECRKGDFKTYPGVPGWRVRFLGDKFEVFLSDKPPATNRPWLIANCAQAEWPILS